MESIHERGIILDHLNKVIKDTFEEINGIPVPDTNGIVFKIISQKITNIIDDKLPDFCKHLEEEVNVKFKDYLVSTEFYSQFPNYPITIELGRKSYPDIDLIYNLKVRISLLTNYFTVFYEEISIHKSCSSMITKFEPVRLRLISSKSEIIDPVAVNFYSLIDAVKKCFSDYNFVGHHLLFNNLIAKRVPYGVFDYIPKKDFPIYAFLFHNEYIDFDSVFVTL